MRIFYAMDGYTRAQPCAEPSHEEETSHAIFLSIHPSIHLFLFTLWLSHRLSRNLPRTRQCKSPDIAIKKLSRSSREQRPLLFPRVQRGRRGIYTHDRTIINRNPATSVPTNYEREKSSYLEFFPITVQRTIEYCAEYWEQTVPLSVHGI